MTPEIEKIKYEAAWHLVSLEPAGPQKLGAVNWRGALDGLDGALQKYVPVIGPLTPPQVAALASLIAEAVHLANGAANHHPVVNPNA